MGIQLGSNFDVQTGLPLDSRMVTADYTSRDAIPLGVRYVGMQVFVSGQSETWQLQGGTANANWVNISVSGTGADPDAIKVEPLGASVDNTVPRFHGTDGLKVQLSAVVISDDNDVSGVRDLVATRDIYATNDLLAGNDIQAAGNISAPTGGLLGDNLTIDSFADIDDVHIENAQVMGAAAILELNASAPTGLIHSLKKHRFSGPVRIDVESDSTSSGSNVTIETPISSYMRLESATLTSIAGIPATDSGHTLILQNATGAILTIRNDSGSATAADRIITTTGGDITLPINGIAWFTYDTVLTRWVIVGAPASSSSASSSGINYATNPNYETDASGATRYHSGAVTRPLGTVYANKSVGGTPTITSPTRTTTTPLRGTGSLLLAKAAGSFLGQGYVLDRITLAYHDAQSVQIQRLMFDAMASSGYVTGDLTFYAIGSDASVNEIVGGGLESGRFIGSFQPAFGITSYDIVAHVSQGTTATWEVRVDNLSVGPQTIVKGAIETDWQPYTPTLTSIGGGSVTLTAGGSLTPLNGQWRRVGDSIEYQASFRNGASPATGTAGAIVVGIPPGLTVNTAKLATNVGSIRGDGFVTTAVDNYVGSAYYAAPYNGLQLIVNGIASYVAVANLTAGIGYTISGRLPIAGWSSNMALSEDFGNRNIVAYKHAAIPTGTPTAGVTNTLNFGTLTRDSAGAFSGGTTFTVPETGDYYLSGACELVGTFTAGTDLYLAWYVNGSNVLEGSRRLGDTQGRQRIEATGPLYLLRGQTVTLGCNPPGTGIAYGSSLGGSKFSIVKLGNPQTLAGSETISAKARIAAQNIVTGTSTTLLWNTSKEGSHHANLNSSTGIFTAPASGRYSITAKILMSLQTWAIGNQAQLFLAKNGSSITRLDYHYVTTAASALIVLGGKDDVYLSTGETVQITLIHTRGSDTPLNADPIDNYITITRVGNV